MKLFSLKIMKAVHGVGEKIIFLQMENHERVYTFEVTNSGKNKLKRNHHENILLLSLNVVFHPDFFTSMGIGFIRNQ